jgi:hypothetical protein
MVADRPKKIKVANSDLNRLISALEISFVNLTECVVSPGWRLSFPPNESAGMHYNLAGNGRLIAGTFPAISLTPHTLVILPPMTPFRIEASRQSRPALIGDQRFVPTTSTGVQHGGSVATTDRIPRPNRSASSDRHWAS